MPIGKIQITSTRKSNYGEKIEVNNYWFDETHKPLAVLYGCFSPFTGKNGHGRMLEYAKENGINDFIIVSPPKKEQLDDDRNMFTLEQKVNIAKAGCKDLGYNILDAYIGKWAFVLGNLNDVAMKYKNRRIVLICGPDRAEGYSKELMKYNPNRKEQLPDENNRGKYELIAMDSRGDDNVSGTLIRSLIRDNNKSRFLALTGYSEDIWYLCRNYAIDNGIITESFFENYISEAISATKRVGIKHLYNPGNSQELPQLDFIDMLSVLEQDNGILINGKNVSITEKSDGAAFRMGIDDEGKFFIEQAYSGPIYDSQSILDSNKQRYGIINKLGKGWAHLFDILNNDTNTQNTLNTIFDKIGPFKVSGEIFISELGYKDQDGYVTFVGSRYDETKLGKKATIILFNIADADGVSLDESYVKYIIKNANSTDIKYDDAELNMNDNIKINVGPILKVIKTNINNIEKELEENNTSIEEILTSKSRTKQDVAARKELKSRIEEQQGLLNNVFEKELENYQGKWGPDYEGIVIKLKDGTMIKITSTKFKEFKAKHDDTMTKWLRSENTKFTYWLNDKGIL